MPKPAVLPTSLALYLKRYFLSAAQIEERAGVTASRRIAFERAECVPGAIYRTWANGAAWSQLGDTVLAGSPEGEASEWFSPAAVWWLRMAVVLQAEPQAAALELRSRFERDFDETVRREDDAHLAFPELFDAEGALIDEMVKRCAREQWVGWIKGGYGVCLRRFSAEAVVTKMASRAKIKAAARLRLAPIDVLEEAARLEAVLLPFSPYERASGTPAWGIDAVLARLGCGREAWAVGDACPPAPRA